jgi:catechol 2,3-dioxygenase-like lactoylglutathione lyase family enzyme
MAGCVVGGVGMGLGPLNIVTIQVGDWKGAVTWYSEVLGLEVVASEEDDQFWMLSMGAAMVSLAADHPERSGTTSENRLAPGFQISDFDTTLARLRSAGVRVDPVIDGEGEAYRLARIWDPEGNRLHLYCYG